MLKNIFDYNKLQTNATGLQEVRVLYKKNDNSRLLITACLKHKHPLRVVTTA